MKSWILDSDETLIAAVTSANHGMVYYVSGDGTVPVLSSEGGQPLTIQMYTDFVDTCIQANKYGILCVDAGQNAWVDSSDDADDLTKIRHKISGSNLELSDQ